MTAPNCLNLHKSCIISIIECNSYGYTHRIGWGSSSQTDTAFRLAKLKGLDLNTFPVFPKNDTNKFTKEQTYINCNNVIEISENEFGRLIKDGKVHRLDGRIDELGLQLIGQGVKLSPEVEDRIKDLFD